MSSFITFPRANVIVVMLIVALRGWVTQGVIVCSYKVCMGTRLVAGRKLALHAAAVCVFLVNGFAFGSLVILGNILLSMVVFLASMPLDVYLLYLVLILRRKPQYPLVSPEGKWDMYLPRTNIPRPLYEDFRRMKERKRKFAKINRMVHKRAMRKKKR